MKTAEDWKRIDGEQLLREAKRVLGSVYRLSKKHKLWCGCGKCNSLEKKVKKIVEAKMPPFVSW